MTTRARRLAALFVLASVGGTLWLRLGPLPPGLLDPIDDVSTIVVDRHGDPLYEARSTSGSRGVHMRADDVPAALASATVAAEDHRFHIHPGIDPIAIVRAAATNMLAGRAVEGASTITQQVVKLLLDRRATRPRARGVHAKLVEAVAAIRLEHRFSKGEILAMYLNLAPYGNQVVGAARASEIYFGVPASILTVAQAAFLAGLPQRPSAFSPYRDRLSGLARQQSILDRLVRAGGITRAAAAAARAERLTIQPRSAAFAAPHFVEMVLSRHARRGRIDTTLDAGLQREIAGIVESQRHDLERHGAHNAAIVVLDNRTGDWLVWHGSADYTDQDHGGAINGVLSPRQPGSALKPFAYALGFERGLTPATVLPDIQATYPTAQQGILYTPRNYDGRFHGPLRARDALAGSQNVPAVALVSRVGVPDLLRFLKSLGLTTLDRNAAYYGLGLTLGNAEVSLAQLTGAYAALARGGVWVEPRATFDAVVKPAKRVMSAQSAYWVTDILSDPDARAYVFGRGGHLEFSFPVAAKTGTSQAYRDNWALGYTREVTVGVWVGNFDRRPLVGSSGVTGAGPIFHAVMLAAHRHVRGRDDAAADIVERPADLVDVRVCGLSGMRSGAACPTRRREWLPVATSPLPCSWHHASERGLLTLWPDEYRAWAADHQLLEDDFHDERPMRVVRATGTAREQPFEIVNPPDGGVYLIDPTLRLEFQALPLHTRGARGRIEWRVDGRRLRGVANARGSWVLRPGVHEVTARDASGRSASATIRVK